MIKPKKEIATDIKVGDKVYGVFDGSTYEGTIYNILASGKKATVKRDDGGTGDGVKIIGAPYNGRQGWIIHKKIDNTWGSNGELGKLYVFSQIITSWKKTLGG